jgi:hypothetical protein
MSDRRERNGQPADRDPSTASAPSSLDARRARIAHAEALGIDGADKLTAEELDEEIRRAEGGGGGRRWLERAAGWVRDLTETALRARATTRSESAPLPTLPDPVDAARGDIGDIGDGADEQASLIAEIQRAQGLAATVDEVNVERARPVPSASAPAPTPVSEADASAPAYAPAGLDALAHLAAADFAVAASIDATPPTPPAPPPAMPDDRPWPERYGVDECVAMPVDANTLFVYWELRPESVARARRVLRRDAPLDAEPEGTLRVLIVEPSAEGPRTRTRDLEVVDAGIGEHFVRELPPGAVLRAAIGLKLGTRFLPLAHTLDVETPRASASPAAATTLGRWTPPTAAERASYRQAAVPFPARTIDVVAAPPALLAAAGASGAALEPARWPPAPRAELRTDDLPPGVGISSAALARPSGELGGPGVGAGVGPSSAAWIAPRE